MNSSEGAPAPALERVGEGGQKERAQISRRERILAPLALGASYLAVAAFFENPLPRLGVFLSAAAMIALFLWYCKKESGAFGRAGLFLLSSGALLALSFVTNAGNALYPLSLLAVYALILCGALVAVREPDWARPRALFIEGASALYALFRDSDKLAAACAPPRKSEWVKKALAGLLISLPVLFVVTGLLSSADAVFDDLMRQIFRFNLFDLVARIFYTLLYGSLLFGFLYCVKNRKAPENLAKAYEKEQKGSDGIVFLTLVGSLCAIYAVFVVIQFAYLFAGNLPEGLTYAEYARRGFFELAFITALNISIVLLAVTFARPGKISKTLRILGGAMMAFTLVILVSAVYRMALYVSAYGLSVLRFLVLWGEGLMLIFIALTVLKLLKPGFSTFRYFAGTFIVFYLGLSFCAMDAQIARYNVSRHNAGAIVTLDYGYLSRLSVDALPAVQTLPDSAEKRELLNALNAKRSRQRENFFSWNLSLLKEG